MKAAIGLLVLLIILGRSSTWEKAYEPAGSVSFSIVVIKKSSALSLIKAMELVIKPTVRLAIRFNTRLKGMRMFFILDYRKVNLILE